MGNAQSLTRTSGALDSFVAELGPDVVYERRYILPHILLFAAFLDLRCCCATNSLGSARFLKTVRCRHRNGYLVVKIFIKPDPGLSLRRYSKRLKSAYFHVGICRGTLMCFVCS